MAKRFILLDGALEGLGGHYFDYARRALGAARAEGYETFLVTRRDVAIDSFDGHAVIRALTNDFWRNFADAAGDVTPFFVEAGGFAARVRRAWGLDFSAAGFTRALLRKLALASFLPLGFAATALRRLTPIPLQNGARRFAEDLTQVDRSLGGFASTDVVFLPSIFVVETAGLARFIASRRQSSAPQWRLLFRRDLDVEQRSSAAVLSSRRRRLANVLDRLARQPQVRFFTDTPQLSSRYGMLSAAVFATAPIPVEAPLRGPRAAPAPLNIVFLGGACEEKGFHHLAELVERAPPSERLNYIFQANYSTPVGEPTCVAARDALQDKEGVQLVEGPLSTTSYASLLSTADAVLLPYDPTAYRARSSGIFTEALACGVPVIATAGTWMASCLQVLEQAWLDGLEATAEANEPFNLLFKCSLSAAAGSVTFQGETPSGSKVRVTRDAASELRFLVPPRINGETVRYGLVTAEGRALTADIRSMAVSRRAPPSAVGLIVQPSAKAMAQAVGQLAGDYQHFRSTAQAHSNAWSRTHSAKSLLLELIAPTCAIRG